MKQLHGQTALVTGGSRGVGKGVALELIAADDDGKQPRALTLADI